MLQKKPLHGFARIEKEKVYQATDDADEGGEDEMEGFFLENDFLTPVQRGLPMSTE